MSKTIYANRGQFVFVFTRDWEIRLLEDDDGDLNIILEDQHGNRAIGQHDADFSNGNEWTERFSFVSETDNRTVRCKAGK